MFPILDGKPLNLQWGLSRTNTSETKALVRGSFQDVENNVDSLNALRALIGQAYGEQGFDNRYRFIYNKTTKEFCAQRNTNTEAVPVFEDVWCIRLADGQFQVVSPGGIQSNAGFYGPIPRELDTIGEIGATGNTEFTRINKLFFNTDLGFYLTSLKSGSNKGKPVLNFAFPFGRSQTFKKTAKVWQIDHNYGVTPVLVQVMNDHDVVIIPDKIDVSNPNSAFFYFHEVTSGKVIIATGGTGAAALVPINPFYLAVRTDGQSADGKVMRDNVDLLFDKNFFYVNVNLDLPGGAHKRASVSFIPGSDSVINFKDGSVTHVSDTLNFNSEEFYLSTDLAGKPVVNLEIFDKDQTFTGTVTADAFYLTPGSGGELSKSGNDVRLASSDGDVLIGSNSAFKLESGAAANALVIDSNNRINFNATAPSINVEIHDADDAAGFRVRSSTGDASIFLAANPGSNVNIDLDEFTGLPPTNKWTLRKDGNNDFQLIDRVNNTNVITVEPGTVAIAHIFYISRDSNIGIRTPTPTAPLHVAGKGRFDEMVEAEAFYLTAGEISQSGSDLIIKSSTGQTIIDDDLRVTHNVVAGAFYTIDGSEAVLTDGSRLMTGTLEIDAATAIKLYAPGEADGSGSGTRTEINHAAAAPAFAAVLSFNPLPSININKAQIGIFRNSDGNSNSRLVMYRADGSNTEQHSLLARGDSGLALEGNMVGIGTASPTAILHVVGTGLFTGAIDAQGGFSDNITVNGDVTADAFYLPSSGGELSKSGSDVRLKSSAGSVLVGTDSQFVVESGAAADTLVVDSNSRVGIGTAGPGFDLHVFNASAAALATIESNNAAAEMRIDANAGSNADMTLLDGGTKKWIWRKDSTNTLLLVDTAGGSTVPLKVETGAVTNTLVIDSNSRVGIGTAAPTALLNVAGFALIDDSLRVENIITAEAFYTFDGGDLSAAAPSDHGGLTGLADDDHTQYLLVDGTRAMSGTLDMGNNNIQDIGLVEGDLHVDGDVTSEAFYILPVGEVSSSGDDLLIKTDSGQVVIDDSLRVTDKVVAERFYLINGGEVGEIVTRIVRYTGDGVSGLTVTLTGINRAHVMHFQRYDTNDSTGFTISIPDGDTGSVFFRGTDASGDNTISLDAPAAGTDQILTINNTATGFNANGVTYRAAITGTRT